MRSVLICNNTHKIFFFSKMTFYLCRKNFFLFQNCIVPNRFVQTLPIVNVTELSVLEKKMTTI